MNLLNYIDKITHVPLQHVRVHCVISFSGMVLFYARQVEIVNGSTNNLTFPLVDTNVGHDYNSTSGVFTCDISGYYWFSVTLTADLNKHIDRFQCDFIINERYVMLLYIDPGNDQTSNSTLPATGSMGYHLNHGDRVHVGNCQHPERIDNYLSTHFSGILIKPDA